MTLVLVMRCADQPIPLTPAVIVQCASCGNDCWLSAATGLGTIAAAARFGAPAIGCNQCVEQLVLDQGLTPSFFATPEALNEFRGGAN